jgi:phosphatidate phosphatase PAH1
MLLSSPPRSSVPYVSTENNNTSTNNNSNSSSSGGSSSGNDRVITLEKEVLQLKSKLEKSSEAYQQIVNQSKKDKDVELQLKEANEKINSLKVEKHTLELSVKVGEGGG